MSWIAQGFTNVINAITSSVTNIFNTLVTLGENIGQWFSELGENIGGFFGNLITNISNLFGDLGQNLANWFSSLFSNLGNILSYINPFSENFFGYKIIDLFSDLFEFLFVPSGDGLEDIYYLVEQKFNFVDSIKIGINALKNSLDNVNSVPTYSLDVNSKYYTGDLKILDLSWYAPFKPYGDLVITGFVYIFFLWRLFVKVPSIVNGISSGVEVSMNSFRKD